jgi:hypothetical protein
VNRYSWLGDRLIEYATLYEDGLLEVTFGEKAEKTLSNVFRDIEFKKDLSP